MKHFGVKSAVNQAWLWVAGVYRTLVLKDSRFVVVTGSCGKTTTKELAAAVLSQRYRVFRSPFGGNLPYHFQRYFLQMRPKHECCVIEAAGADHEKSVDLEDFMAKLRPSVSVVTTVGLDHFSLFGTCEAVAAHKGKVVDALTHEGIAVLNADDPYVIGMSSRSKGRVVTFGFSEHATVRGQDINACWPDRLAMTVTCGAETVRVQTQLCGPHFAADVLAALAAGHAMGVPLGAAAEAIAGVVPYPRRMCPIEKPEGVTFICDNEKAPYWTLPLTFEFMRTARAVRKVLVLGTISDYSGNPSRRCRQVCEDALEVVDVFVGVGALSTLYLAASERKPGVTLKAFPNSGEALEFLHAFLEPGDLVLLKGSEGADNMQVIAERWHLKPTRPNPAAEAVSSLKPETDEQTQLIVGLGNPDSRYSGSPHNVGQQAVEVFAAHFGANWRQESDSMVAEATVDGSGPLRFLKLRSWMNDSGPALRNILAKMKITPEQCILVFDDVTLPLGTIRMRESGSAGGHKGVESILIALQTQKIRRLKIGVGQPPDGDMTSFVTRPFAPEQSLMIDDACQKSLVRLKELLEKWRQPTPIAGP